MQGFCQHGLKEMVLPSLWRMACTINTLKYLCKSGWKVVFNNGNDYLSVKIIGWEPHPKKLKRKRAVYDKCNCE
ncbi:MAG: hypothetical protein R2750_10600 [Bacteroidales bacterium]